MLSLPLTETDRGQLVSIYGEVHERALAKLKARELPKEMQALINDDFLQFVREIIVKPGADELLVVSCRLPGRLALPAHPSGVAPTEDEQGLQKETIAVIKAAGIPVRTDAKLEDVVAKFRGDR